MRTTLCVLFAVVPLTAQDRVSQADELFPGCTERDGEQWIVSRVVDDLSGRPVAGAEVFLLAEVETPIAGEFWSTRRAKTDADGYLRVRVDDIDGKWHIQAIRHPDIGTGTRAGRGAPIWRVGRPFDVPVLVLDHAGRPAPGAKVGFCGGDGQTPDLENAVADQRGIAVLRAIDPHNETADVYVQHPGLDLGYRSIEWFPGGPPFAVTCGIAPPITGRVVDHTGKPVVGAFVGAPHVQRGPWTRTAADGSFTLLGGPATGGPTQVRIPGREMACHFPTPARCPVTLRLPDLSDPEAQQGTIDVPERDADADADADADVVLATDPARAWRLVAKVVAPDGKPIDARFRLRRNWSVGRDDGEARLRKAEGGAIEAEFDQETTRAGVHLLEILPDRDDLQPRYVWVTLPLPGGEQPLVDAGTIALRAEPQLRVLDAAGKPLDRPVVRWLRAGFQEVGEAWRMRSDEHGGCRGADLRAGDVVLVQREVDDVPFRMELTGDGPWTVRAPDGALDLQIVDAQGQPLEATVSFADLAFEDRDQLALRGLPHGPLRLYVAAPNHRTAVVETAVAAAARTVRVVLKAR